MERTDNMKLAKQIRQEIKTLRIKGYTYKIFSSVVNYSSTDFYNFMRGYHMSDDNLLALKDYLYKNMGVDLDDGLDPEDKGGKALSA